MHLPEVNLASISTSNSVQMESSVENTAQNGQINEEDDEQTVGGARDSQTAPDVSDTPETQSDTKPESSFALSEEEIEYTPQKNLRLAKVPIMPLQKRETAIMRLTNRIKALETNVSLSSRYGNFLWHFSHWYLENNALVNVCTLYLRSLNYQ